MQWIIYGVTKDDEREEVTRVDEWKDVVEWVDETWAQTWYYGLVIMPDDGMLTKLKEVDG